LTLYDILGVPQDASADEIRRAYYRLAKETHPDQAQVSSDAEFRIIDTAYTTLSDPVTRKKYDATVVPPQVAPKSTPTTQRVATAPKPPPRRATAPARPPTPQSRPTPVKKQHTKAQVRVVYGYLFYIVAALIFLANLPEKGQPGIWGSCFLASWIVPITFHYTRKVIKSRSQEATPPVIPSSTHLSVKWYRGKKGTAVISIVLAVIIATSIFVITQVESKTGHSSGHSSGHSPGWSALSDVDPGSRANSGISSISCPTTSFCMAVDSNGRSLSYSRGKWSVPDSIDPYGILNSVSCPTTSFCMAVDVDGDSLTYNKGTWSKPDIIDPLSSTTGNGGGISSVSCPTTSFCMAVDDLGNALSYDKGKWSAPDSIDPQSAKNHNAGTFGLTSVSCPTTSFCMAVDVLGNALSYNNGKWSAPDSIDPQSSTAGSGYGNGMSSVSCPTTSFCMAVDGDGDSLQYLAGKWSAPTSIGGIFNSVSCPTASFCMALDLGDALHYSNGRRSVIDSIDPNGTLSSVSCPTTSFCMAVDNNGNSLTYNPVAQP